MLDPFWAAFVWSAPPASPSPPSCGTYKSPGMKNTTLLASAPHSISSSSRLQGVQGKEGCGSHASPWCSPSLQSPLPSSMGTPVGGAEHSEVPFHPAVPPLSPVVLASAPRKARVGGSGVQHPLLGFSHFFSASAYNLRLSQQWGLLICSCLGNPPSKAKRRKEARRTVTSRDVILKFGCHRVFLLHGDPPPLPEEVFLQPGLCIWLWPLKCDPSHDPQVKSFPCQDLRRVPSWTCHRFFCGQPVAALAQALVSQLPEQKGAPCPGQLPPWGKPPQLHHGGMSGTLRPVSWLQSLDIFIYLCT